MIAPATIERVRQFPDIVGVISEYVSLKKRGRNFLGLCPFHAERSPSFTVNAERRLWHCFGCKQGGDLLDFLMQIENISFHEAVREVAARAGIPIQEDERAVEKERGQADVLEWMQRLVVAARDHYRAAFAESIADRYMASRGISAATAARFDLGFSQGHSVVEILLQKGFTPEQIDSSGVAFQSQSSWVDRFSGRLIFPITDHRGRTVGFGGRRLSEDTEAAKYINSSENILFKKSRILYGLAQAKSAIKKAGFCILMEGYMDVVTAHQFGFEMAVGCMGTAVTHEQAVLIGRFSKTVVLALDSDHAGQTAIERSIPILKALDFQVHVATFGKKDPADVLTVEGVAAFQSALDVKVAVPMFFYRRYLATMPTQTIEEKAQLVERMVPILRQEKDTVVRNHYIQNLAKDLNINSELIVARIQNYAYNKNINLSQTVPDKFKRAEELLIYTIATHPHIRAQLAQQPVQFVTPAHQVLVDSMLGQTGDLQAVVDRLDDMSRKQVLQIVMQTGQWVSDLAVENHWQDYVETLRSYHRRNRIHTLKEQIRQEEESGDESVLVPLLNELQVLLSTSPGGADERA